MPLAIEPLSGCHFEQLHNLFDSVCREKRFMAFTHAGPRSETFAYYQGILDRKETHFVAVDGGTVVGWCDVLRQFPHVRQHVGNLGIAVAASHRGRGLGRLLITRAIEDATSKGLTRIELTVHADNLVGQALYKSVGFALEGIQRDSWLIDGRYFDVQLMARISEA